MFTEDTDLRHPDLRWNQTEDHLTECSCIPRRLKRDKLYFHGPGKLAIHYHAETSRAAGCRAKFWRQKLREEVEWYQGTWDGIVVFKARSLVDVPKEFFKSERGGNWGQGFARKGSP